MSANHKLALALVDELEELGAGFSFFLDSRDQIAVTWACQGVARFQRCCAILRTGMVNTPFGDAFKEAIEDRYVAGRLRLDRRSA